MNETDKSELLPIGEMAALCQISTKSLRHYDKIGLLKPAFVDPDTKYRYYSHHQVFCVIMIKELKFRNLSLPETIKFINTKNLSDVEKIYYNRKTMLDNEIEKLVQARKRVTKRIELFEQAKNLADTNKLDNPEVNISELEEINYVCSKTRDFYNIKTLSSLFNNLQNSVFKHGLDTIEPYFAVFYDDFEKTLREKINFAFCYPLNSLPPSDFSSINKLPSGLYASIYSQGDIENSINDYKKLVSFIKKNNYQIIGPTIRSFIISYSHIKSYKKVITELKINVKKI